MKLRTIGLISTLVLGLLAGSLPAEAQQAGKVPRIGYVSGSDSSSEKALLDAFRQRLRELGWIEGKNITIEYRYGAVRGLRAKLIAELVQRKVDVRYVVRIVVA